MEDRDNGAIDWEGYIRECREGHRRDLARRKELGIKVDEYTIFDPDAECRDLPWETGIVSRG